MAEISLGKEAYFNQRTGRICYGEAFISNGSGSRVIHKNAEADITDNVLRVAVQYLLAQKEQFARLEIARKGKYKLKIERIEEDKQ